MTSYELELEEGLEDGRDGWRGEGEPINFSWGKAARTAKGRLMETKEKST